MPDLFLPGVAAGSVVTLFGMCLVLFRVLLRTDRTDRAELRRQFAVERESFQKRFADQERLNREECGRLADRLTLTESHNARCERRLNILINAAREGGLPIPPEVWSEL